MTLPSSATVSIAVIDNDSGQSARAVVETLRDVAPVPLRYYCEAKRGIPCARNRAIEETHKLQADYLVFVDDDERVDASWLRRLYGHCRQAGGDIVVSGEVNKKLPSTVPEHIRVLLENNKDRKTGERLLTCATNNVIFPVSLTRELGLRFDDSIPLAGGTDTQFFCDAVNKGVRIEHCAEAVVYENYPESRATLKWLVKRKFRVGIDNAKRKLSGGRSWFSILISAFLQLLVYSFACLSMSLVNSKAKRNKVLLKASRSAGEVLGLMGVRVNSY